MQSSLVVSWNMSAEGNLEYFVVPWNMSAEGNLEYLPHTSACELPVAEIVNSRARASQPKIG